MPGDRDTERPPTDGVSDWPTDQMAVGMVRYTPYAKALGMRYVSSTADRGTILLPWREDLVGIDGTDILSPGAVTALIDHACGLAIMVSTSFGASAATLDLRIDHMRPAAPRASVTCSAHVYRATRTIAFLRAEAWDVTRDDPVAAAQAAFTLNRRSVK